MQMSKLRDEKFVLRDIALKTTFSLSVRNRIVEVVEKKITHCCIAEETRMFCSILVDTVNNFMLALEQKALKKLPQKRNLRQF